MRKVVKLVLELLGVVGMVMGMVLLGGEGSGPDTVLESVAAVALILIGWWVFVFRYFWLNRTENPELTKNFSPERIDRPIPFTFRCSELRFCSELSPEELRTALDNEIVQANGQLASWHREEKDPVSWKVQWKLKWKGDRLTLLCVRSAKATWIWERVHGAAFMGRIFPRGLEGSYLQGHFGWPLPSLLIIPALFWLPGWIGLFLGEPGSVLAFVPWALSVLLRGLGRGSYGVDALTVETQKALMDFFGEPEVLE